MSNWDYARATPTVDFRGSLSLPRQLRLAAVDEGLRLAARVPDEVRALFNLHALDSDHLAARSGTYLLEGDISLLPGESVSIALFGEASPQLVFARAASGELALVDVPRRPLTGSSEFAHRYEIPLGMGNGLSVQVYVDEGSVEMVLADGLIWVTNLYFPSRPSGAIEGPQAAG